MRTRYIIRTQKINVPFTVGTNDVSAFATLKHLRGFLMLAMKTKFVASGI